MCHRRIFIPDFPADRKIFQNLRKFIISYSNSMNFLQKMIENLRIKMTDDIDICR